MTLTNSSTRAAIEKLVSQNVEKILFWKKCRLMHCFRGTDSQNVMYTKFYVIELHQKWRAHRVFRGCCDWTTSMLCQNSLRLLHFTPVTNTPQYVHSLPNNSVLWVTCLIKHASHLPEQAFTRESVSGGELLHTSFAKKAKQKK